MYLRGSSSSVTSRVCASVKWLIGISGAIVPPMLRPYWWHSAQRFLATVISMSLMVCDAYGGASAKSRSSSLPSPGATTGYRFGSTCPDARSSSVTSGSGVAVGATVAVGSVGGEVAACLWFRCCGWIGCLRCRGRSGCRWIWAKRRFVTWFVGLCAGDDDQHYER